MSNLNKTSFNPNSYSAHKFNIKNLKKRSFNFKKTPQLAMKLQKNSIHLIITEYVNNQRYCLYVVSWIEVVEFI